MKNASTKDLIRALERLDPDAIVCRIDENDQDVQFVTIEVCRQESNAEYIDDAGQTKKGNIVVII